MAARIDRRRIVVELLLLALSAVSLALVAALLYREQLLSVLPSLAGAVTTASGFGSTFLPASDAAAAWIGSRASGFGRLGRCDFDLLERAAIGSIGGLGGRRLAVRGAADVGNSPSVAAEASSSWDEAELSATSRRRCRLKADEAAGRDGRMGRRRGGCGSDREVDRVSIALSGSSPKVASLMKGAWLGPVGLVPGAAASVFGAKAASMPSAVKAGLPLSAPNLAAARARSSARMASRSAGLMV